MQANDDRFWMQRALALARRGVGRTRPNPPVGAVIVRSGRAVGRGYHRRAGGPHAEVYALRQAGTRAQGATLYVTLEPCSTRGRTGPCTAAVVAAGIARVVVGARDPNPRHRGRGLDRLRRRGVRVASGVCSDEAGRLLRPFAKWITRGVPFVTLKMGMTLDGRIADASGRSRWITSAVSRRVVRQLRKEADAILVGSSTAVRDDPSLLAGRASSPAWRVVVDAHGRLPPTARLLNDGAVGRTIMATTRKCTPRRLARWRGRGAAVWVLPEARGHVSLGCVLRRLGRMGILHVLCEGGGEVAAALIRGGHVDEFLFFVAPGIMGGGAVPVVGGAGWSLAGAPRLKFAECRRVGPDLLIRATPLRRGEVGQR